ncbi:MAG TPA: hypothetical protein VH835_00630, partial [Dongiaceae bacterium]
ARDTADSPRRGRSDRGRSQGQPSGKAARRRKYEDRPQAADARGGGGRSAPVPVANGRSGGEEKRTVPSWGKPATPQQPRNRNKRGGAGNSSVVVANGSWQPRTSGGQKNGHRHQPSR